MVTEGEKSNKGKLAKILGKNSWRTSKHWEQDWANRQSNSQAVTLAQWLGKSTKLMRNDTGLVGATGTINQSQEMQHVQARCKQQVEEFTLMNKEPGNSNKSKIRITNQSKNTDEANNGKGTEPTYKRHRVKQGRSGQTKHKKKSKERETPK